jgi:hypothetical protein
MKKSQMKLFLTAIVTDEVIAMKQGSFKREALFSKDHQLQFEIRLRRSSGIYF